MAFHSNQQTILALVQNMKSSIQNILKVDKMFLAVPLLYVFSITFSESNLVRFLSFLSIVPFTFVIYFFCKKYSKAMNAAVIVWTFCVFISCSFKYYYGGAGLLYLVTIPLVLIVLFLYFYNYLENEQLEEGD